MNQTIRSCAEKVWKTQHCHMVEDTYPGWSVMELVPTFPVKWVCGRHLWFPGSKTMLFITRNYRWVWVFISQKLEVLHGLLSEGFTISNLKVTIHLSRDTPNIPLSKPGINYKSYIFAMKKKKAMKSLLETSSFLWVVIYIFYPNENEHLTKLRLSSFWSILTITDSNAPDK